MSTPKLTLVGAGPGDPDLITLKGLNALGTAGVVLYDALVTPALLDRVPAGVPKIFVGKRKGQHELTQDQLNELIANLAFSHGHVVRLKGGDPFIFGRGYEELQAAQKLGIPTEYIPGISSATAVPGLQGIPVTHRGSSESFWVITGTTSSGEVSQDITTAAGTNATVVILMGFGQLQKIVDVYLSKGRPDLPVAIIQNGSCSNEIIALGTIDTIVQIAEIKKVGIPAVIVIGETVKLHSDFPDRWKELEDILSDLRIEYFD